MGLTKASGDSIDRAIEALEDWGVLLDPTQQLLAVMWAIGYTAQSGGEITDSFFITHPAAAEYARSRAGELIVGIDEWTRMRIRQVLEDIYEDPNVTLQEVIDAINDLFGGMAKVRATLIARTEMAYAEGYGSSSAWREIGVEYVSISDAMSQDTDEPCLVADGQIWTLDYYEANILEHPNCTRAATPLMASTVEPSMVDEG